MTEYMRDIMYFNILLLLFRNKQLAMLKKKKKTPKEAMCERVCHKMGLLAHCCSEWLEVGECWALERSDDRRVSRLRGKKSDGRHRKTGRQVNISDGDGPQRTSRLLHSSQLRSTHSTLLDTQQDSHYQCTKKLENQGVK